MTTTITTHDNPSNADTVSKPVKAAAEKTAWQPVPPLDATKVRAADFTDLEIEDGFHAVRAIPYSLVHFHRVANSVVENGPHRGYFDLAVWRLKQYNQPHNARVMESILTLAYFYCTDRPWNPYRGTLPVRLRLEAALEFWLGSQNVDGAFAEYRPDDFSLPATAFATKFMAQTLTVLQNGPPIDAALHGRIIAANRKAILHVLKNPSFYHHAKRFSNQFGNVWAGGLGYIALYPDTEIEPLLRQKLEQSARDFQSEAGFLYEKDGPDWSYNFGTHHSNSNMAWHYARNSDLAPFFVEEERRFAEWLAYNAVIEPDGSSFILNSALETRQKTSYLRRLSTPLAEKVEMMRAFGTSTEERESDRQLRRRQLEASWPQVDDLSVGDSSAYSPYIFLHRDQHQWLPSAAQRTAAIQKLPYLARSRFVHQRVDQRGVDQRGVDDHQPQTFTFVRRPSYYAAFNAGPLMTEQQRLGLGLLWHPQSGALLQSQTDSADDAWGTRAVGAAHVHEAANLNAAFTVTDLAVIPVAGNRDLTDGDLRIAYKLSEKGTKNVRFTDEGIEVSIRHTDDFHEQLPLLHLQAAKVETQGNSLILVQNSVTLCIECEGAAQLTLHPASKLIGAKKLTTAHIAARDALTYRISIRVDG